MPAPELANRSFHNILVFANFPDLGLRRDSEMRFAAASLPDHYRFVPSHQLFFPGRQYSQEEIGSILRNNSIDAALVVAAGGTGSSSTYVPPTYKTGCTVWTTSGGCQQTTTTSSGGGTYSKPWAQFSAQLFDATTGQIVWYATATTGGNAYARVSTLVHSMTDKTLEKLSTDRVIR